MFVGIVSDVPSPSSISSTNQQFAAKKSSFSPLQLLVERYQQKENKGYVSQEFQDYGYRLAHELDDLEHKSLYIKIAKTYPRSIIELARGYVSDAANARSKARLFMWKLRELKKQQQQKDDEKKQQEQKETVPGSQQSFF